MRFVHELRTPRVVFGAGALDQVAEEAAKLAGRRVLLLAGAHSERPRALLAGALAGRLAGVIDEVVEHVPVELAAAAVRRARECRADLVVSLGGGSTTGLAKAIARDVGLPIVAVPTTYAGSEMTDIWGLTESRHKTTGRAERVRPRTVVYDPELTVSLPPSLTAASGMNALAHCVEAAYAAGASPLVQLAAVEGVRALAAGLPACVADPADIVARSRSLYGAWLSGLTLGNAAMGIHHKLCHVLGGAFGLAHGALHSALLPYSAAFNRDAAAGATARLAAGLGAEDAPTGLWQLARRLGAPTSLAAVGVPPDAVDDIARAVAAAPPANPRTVDEEGVRNLLLSALAGRPPGRAPSSAARAVLEVR
jgi:maleylacetate reductase